MNVIFDVWIRDNGRVKYTPEQEIFFETIFNYIYDRVHHIIDEIDAEEEAGEKNGEKPKAIIVYILKRPYAIQPARYSDKLHNRIVGCFNENDARLLWESVATALITFNN